MDGIKAFGGLLLPLPSARPKKNVSVTSPQLDSSNQIGSPSVPHPSQQANNAPAASYSEPIGSSRQTDYSQPRPSDREDTKREPVSRPNSPLPNIILFSKPIDGYTLERAARMVPVHDLFLEWKIDHLQKQQNESRSGTGEGSQSENEIEHLKDLRYGEEDSNKKSRIFNLLVELIPLQEWLEQDQAKWNALKLHVVSDRLAALDFMKKKRRDRFQQLTETMNLKEIEDILDICIQRDLIPKHFGIMPGDSTWQRIMGHQ